MIHNGLKSFLRCTGHSVKKLHIDRSLIIKRKIFRLTLCHKGIHTASEDVFGTLAGMTLRHDTEFYRDDKPQPPLCEEWRNIKGTLIKMKTLLDQQKYSEAKGILLRMEENYTAPADVYVILMNYCGDIGNLSEAFHLYNRYKKRVKIVLDNVPISLLRACARSKDSEYALKVTESVANYSLANEKRRKVHNPFLYALLLHAYGLHKDLISALLIFHKVQTLFKLSQIPQVCYHNILAACCNDKNTGLSFALMIWRYMLMKGMHIDEVSLSLMLSCVKNCELGDVKLAAQIFHNIYAGNQTTIPVLKLETRENQEGSRQLVPSQTDASLGTELRRIFSTKSNYQQEPSNSELPNLLLLKCRIGSLSQLNDFSTSDKRLLLCGGVQGILEAADILKIKLNAKCMLKLLLCLPQTNGADEELCKVMGERQIPIDNIFMNALVQRMIIRQEMTIEDIEDIFKSYRLQPDLLTMNVIAKTCKTHESGKNFLDLAKKYKIRLNSTIMKSILLAAAESHPIDEEYISTILTVVKEQNIQPLRELKLIMKKCRLDCV